MTQKYEKESQGENWIQGAMIVTQIQIKLLPKSLDCDEGQSDADKSK